MMKIDYYLLVPAIAVIITFVHNAIQDLRYRRVKFEYWMPMVVVSIPFIAIWYFNMFMNMRDIFFMIFGVIVLICGIFYICGRIGIIGGADSIGIICLFVCLPAFPFTPISGESSYGIFPIAVLINAVVMGLILTPFLLTIDIDEDGVERRGIPYIVPLCIAVIMSLFIGDIITMMSMIFSQFF